MITSSERNVYSKLITQAQGTMDNLLDQKREAEEQVARIDAAIAKAQVELDTIKNKLQPEVAEFDAVVEAEK